MDIPLRRKVGKLSGGQQAQVALTIALARRPELDPGQAGRTA
jgi:ABC-2 type transport system ATP-binding protein